MSDLFRPEVIEARRHLWFGEVSLVQPVSLLVISGISVAIAVCILSVALLATYTKRIHATGVIAPSTGLITVRTSDAGVVERVLVTGSAEVRKGDKIAVLKKTADIPAGSVGDQLGEISKHSESAVNSMHSSKLRALDRERAQVMVLLGSLVRDVEAAYGDVELRAEQLRIIEGELTRWTSLREQKLVSESDFNAKKIGQMDAQARHSSSLREASRLKRERDELQQRLNAIEVGRERAPIDLQANLAVVEEDGVQRAQQTYSVLVSPLGGRVLSKAVDNGQYVAAGAAIVTIQPKDSVLGAYLFVPSSGLAYVKTGTVVRVRIDAYPYQRYGYFSAVVRLIERSPSEAFSPPVVPGGRASPFFRVFLEFRSEDMKRIEGKLLAPGMNIDADIFGERRTLWGWMVLPFATLADGVNQN